MPFVLLETNVLLERAEGFEKVHEVGWFIADRGFAVKYPSAEKNWLARTNRVGLLRLRVDIRVHMACHHGVDLLRFLVTLHMEGCQRRHSRRRLQLSLTLAVVDLKGSYTALKVDRTDHMLRQCVLPVARASICAAPDPI